MRVCVSICLCVMVNVKNDHFVRNRLKIRNVAELELKLKIVSQIRTRGIGAEAVQAAQAAETAQVAAQSCPRQEWEWRSRLGLKVFSRLFFFFLWQRRGERRRRRSEHMPPIWQSFICLSPFYDPCSLKTGALTFAQKTFIVSLVKQRYG